MNKALMLLLIAFCASCQSPELKTSHVVTSDIDNFWQAFDAVVQETDSARQMHLIDSLYIQRGSVGLDRIREVRQYTLEDYREMINRYPKFLNSLRANTLQSKRMAKELNDGITKLEAIYSPLRPAAIYFTMGCMRTNGTTRDSLVLIGSELAMADSSIDISEFEGRTHDWLATYFGSNPLDHLVLLNVHEYVHTQQHPISDRLLYRVLYEGVAEFVSVKAMGVPSAAPAIEYGKGNPRVKEKFEKEMFYEWTHDWLWSNSVNEFGVRDLGYYIGYAIAESHYEQAADKRQAIKELIELDYEDSESVDAFINQTGFFSKAIDDLWKEDQKNRPSVVRLQPFENGSKAVDPNTEQITIQFSEPLNGFNTGVNYSDLGEDAFPLVTDRIWAEDSLSWTLQVKLEPQTKYKFWVTSNFRTSNDVALLPHLVEFETE
ncbi:hypothetical protein KFE98_01730 [bacterium SCSIO 12741]|nr:hypothetical protein KFE98_01730 [bacterium SCSIO 12741]